MKTNKNNTCLDASKFKEILDSIGKRIVICAGTGCVANGSLKLFDALKNKIEKENLNVIVELKYEKKHSQDELYLSKSGCQGFCQMGPLLTILPEDILYTKVKIDDVDDIVEKTLKNNQILDHLVYKKIDTKESINLAKDIPFYKKQTRQILAPCGNYNPEDIFEYIANGGYQSAKKAILEMTDKEVCDFIEKSGLRGRGGGGFPTGKKWDLTRIEKNEKKYVICNADEGDPGAFMDRSVMEGNPHSIIEGMLIAAKAIGGTNGYVYVRLEYPLAVERIRKAVRKAREEGFLGENIFGSNFSFDMIVMEGAGAFVCGEETALIASIEGKRGMPKSKPPFPSQKGLFNYPSVINNVETLSSVPLIIKNGIENFKSLGTNSSPGTKTFALTGHVANTGLIEVPFGTTLKEIVFDIGGGVTDKDGKVSIDNFKAVQIGGPSGGCLTEEHFDLPLDFDSLRSIGAMVGSGGLVVMNQNTCMIQIAKFFMQFTQNESCGKCVSCREGTKQMLALLTDITEGRATMETLELLKTVARVVQKASLCGLGKTAPSPVLSTLKHFEDEYIDHIINKKCKTKECKALSYPEIIAEKCIGCTACARKCPVDAISGEKKEPHKIDENKCINCGVCIETCKFDAII